MFVRGQVVGTPMGRARVLDPEYFGLVLVVVVEAKGGAYAVEPGSVVPVPSDAELLGPARVGS